MAKRERSDTITADIKAFQNAAAGVIQPPKHLVDKMRDVDWQYWEAITRARARDTWTEIDLIRAVSLAKTQADITMLQDKIEIEGYTSVNAKGTVTENPKARALETLSRREIAMARSLHVHAEATVGKSEDASKKLAKEKSANAVVGGIMDDDLIAMPNRAH